MLSSKGLLLFDYDGTLVDGSIGIHEISDATVEALCQARSNGYLTVLASGRSIGMVEPVKHLFDGFITTNGAYARIKGKEYHNRIIDKDVLRRMMEFFQDKHDRIYANVERCQRQLVGIRGNCEARRSPNPRLDKLGAERRSNPRLDKLGAERRSNPRLPSKENTNNTNNLN